MWVIGQHRTLLLMMDGGRAVDTEVFRQHSTLQPVVFLTDEQFTVAQGGCLCIPCMLGWKTKGTRSRTYPNLVLTVLASKIGRRRATRVPLEAATHYR